MQAAKEKRPAPNRRSAWGRPARSGCLPDIILVKDDVVPPRGPRGTREFSPTTPQLGPQNTNTQRPALFWKLRRTRLWPPHVSLSGTSSHTQAKGRTRATSIYTPPKDP